jgi:hypothetical protein
LVGPSKHGSGVEIPQSAMGPESIREIRSPKEVSEPQNQPKMHSQLGTKLIPPPEGELTDRRNRSWNEKRIQ